MASKIQLEKNAGNILDSAEQSQDSKEQFCIIWNGTVKPMLELIKAFTGSRMDENIDKLIYAADQVCSGTNADVSNYCKIWSTFHVKSLLKFAQTFTGPKIDKAIHKFIELSDGFCPQE